MRKVLILAVAALLFTAACEKTEEPAPPAAPAASAPAESVPAPAAPAPPAEASPMASPTS